jgi:hypothetical protein
MTILLSHDRFRSRAEKTRCGAAKRRIAERGGGRTDHSGLMLAARITFAPILRFFGDELAEVGRRAGKHGAAQVGEARIFYRQPPQGRQARRPAGRAADQVRVRHQPVDGEGARNRGAGHARRDRRLEHFSIRLGVSRVREISVAFFFGNTFEK